jgi:hypothetical protein
MSIIDKLHDRARRAIESGEEKYRDAANFLLDARKLGATQRQSAKAIGKSPAWVNALLTWSKGKDRCPFSRAKRRVSVQAAEQRPPTTETQIAKANAERAKAEFQKARAIVVAEMFAPETKRSRVPLARC